MADTLRVSNEGLQVLAAHCGAVSESLVAATPLPSIGVPTQATSGAVGTAYAALAGAITVLAERAQASAVKAAVAGTGFVVADNSGAQSLADIGTSIGQV